LFNIANNRVYIHHDGMKTFSDTTRHCNILPFLYMNVYEIKIV
jgi:hypothetical protein